MTDVFLSYAREDKGFVDRLQDRLRERKVEVWKDDGQIPVGQTITREIEAGIRETKAVILTLSPLSIGKPYVRAERDFAMQLGKPLLCVQWKTTDFRALPFAAAELSADFRDTSDPTQGQFEEFLAALVPYGVRPYPAPNVKGGIAPLLQKKDLFEQRHLNCDRAEAWELLQSAVLYPDKPTVAWTLGDRTQGHRWLLERLQWFLPNRSEYDFLPIQLGEPLTGPPSRSDARDAVARSLGAPVADPPHVCDRLRRRLRDRQVVLLHSRVEPGPDPEDQNIAHYYREWLPELLAPLGELLARVKVVQPLTWQPHGAASHIVSSLLSRLNPFSATRVEAKRARAVVALLETQSAPGWRHVVAPELENITRAQLRAFATAASSNPSHLVEVVERHGVPPPDSLFPKLREELSKETTQ